MSDFEMSGSDLEQMYQEVILEAAKNPHGKEHFAPDLASENASHAAETTVFLLDFLVCLHRGVYSIL